ncbi:unnamed protein product [Peronospora destructor]|uniref:Uncharacterized protein n=1 Tax=Peronospora destructor TaxID=86335 RepID=A0AAV0U6V6_9STRA|nr:unnamed protein product [Peronospora destructor]
METDSNVLSTSGRATLEMVLQCNDNNVPRRASDQRHILAGKDRQHFVLELAKCGKTPQEIEQIVTSNFDDPDSTAASSALAVPVDKE